MNTYYHQDSAKHIDGNINSIHSVRTDDKLTDTICAVIAFFTNAAAVKVIKTIVCAVCFVAFFGIVGSMESGAVGFPIGIGLSALATLIEYLTLKSLAVKKPKK